MCLLFAYTLWINFCLCISHALFSMTIAWVFVVYGVWFTRPARSSKEGCVSITRNMYMNAHSQIVSMFVILFISLQTILFLKKTLFVQKKYPVIRNFWIRDGCGKLLEANYLCLNISDNSFYWARWQVARQGQKGVDVSGYNLVMCFVRVCVGPLRKMPGPPSQGTSIVVPCYCGRALAWAMHAPAMALVSWGISALGVAAALPCPDPGVQVCRWP